MDNTQALEDPSIQPETIPDPVVDPVPQVSLEPDQADPETPSR